MEARRTLLLITMHLLLIMMAHTTRADPVTSAKSTTHFITTLCRGTTYPNLCYDTLSQYTDAVGSNHWKLCNRALWTTLQAARNSSVLVYGLSKRPHRLSRSEAEVVGVCMENVLDGADRIRQSMRAMGVGRLKESNFEWQMSNVKTWMSGVITDMVTCSDAFDEMKVSPDLESRVTGSVDKVEKLASNALSLINSLRCC